jgi:RimJ/RimL family protein N-acetyltransferase
MVVTIETERLRLRPYTADDQAALHDAFADPYAQAFYPQMTDPANVRGWIEWNLRNYQEYGLGLWAVERKDTGGFIGDCGLTYQEVEGRPALEIGYHVAEAARGRGYATEAGRACLTYGFQHTTEPLICSIVDPGNVASRTVAARIHTQVREFVKGGRDMLLFYTTRGEIPPLSKA